MSVLDHTEAGFEKLITRELLDGGGWIGEEPTSGAPADHGNYDSRLGLYPGDLVAFVQDTQPKKWQRLVGLGGGEQGAGEHLLRKVAADIDRLSTIQVLRKGVQSNVGKIELLARRPELKADAKAEQDYAANRLRVVRQVRFDAKKNDSVDVVLFVNGIPTATAELKNLFTSQSVDDAIEQYKTDRDPKNLLFGRRAFVHFAVDSELAYMTTKLAGPRTKFLPFNQGSGGAGEPGTAGNPSPKDGSHPTSYLWREVWQRDAWLELIEDFVFVETPSPEDAKKGATPTIIFPRFHQWDVVRKCSADARAAGAGRNYLIQHSAGSGKSKEIAWLAHDLSTLHDHDNLKVFDKVVVITDRRVLDQQLQAQVLAFEQVRGTVKKIEQDSSQLREALVGDEARVIITTLQKFPFVLKQLEDAKLKDRSYAVIVDEAHSSQSGESATDLKKVLGARTADDLDDEERDGVPPELLATLAARQRQPNLSFFAFTATPKARTLELFGHRPDAKSTARAFHTYSMRQAIDEGFIVDVLRNYTTYEQLYRLADKADKEIEVPKGKAQSKLRRFATFHAYALDQKAAVIVDHYRDVVRPQLNGNGKAMVVTASRQDAVRYKQAIDRYISEHSYDDVKTLVAFSGEVTIKDPHAPDYGLDYTEPKMNAIAGKPLSEKKLPAEFDKAEYGVLVVAEKYQTGFDQPKLVGMYVDKKLSGVNAVQTLSRLNRIYSGKRDTFIIDFANDAEEIRKAFEPFYGRTEATPTEPSVLFEAQGKVLDFGVITDEDLDAFAAAYYRDADDHAVLSGATQAAFDRVQALDDEEAAEGGRDEFRDALERFTRFYSFLSQVIPYVPPETEKLYVFARFLALRLAAGGRDGGLALDVELTHYRLDETGTTKIGLGSEDVDPLSAIHGDGTGSPRGAAEIPMGLLGELVELFNERFGADLTDADAVRPIQHIIDKLSEEGGLREQALANEFEDFERGKEALVIGATLQVKDVNDLILQKLLDDEELRGRATHLVMRSLYERYQGEAA
ncbi:MAG: type restriction enzyme subunit [Thermoleophilaceae bacterium]|nr:type restriction enzyme subunit [Thermoleophilaceae bacterium]